MASEFINILGKDYLTEAEAAFFVGVSKSHFRNIRERHRLPYMKFEGKNLYRKTDLQRMLDDQWQRSTNAGNLGTSIGAKRESNTA